MKRLPAKQYGFNQFDVLKIFIDCEGFFSFGDLDKVCGYYKTAR
jgi:hypothetical protein